MSWTGTKLRPLPAARLMALGSAAVFTAIFVLLRRPGLPPARWLGALAVTASFALLARLARGVDWSGTLAGAAVAFILIARRPALFLVLLLVFAVTLVAT